MTSEAQKKAIAKYESTKARIAVRLTPEEKKEVCKRAAEAGQSVNEYCKGKILGAE